MATTTKLVELFNAFADASLVDSTATAFVEAAYENLLGLSGDFSNKDARVAYWVEQIEGGVSRADFANTFLTAAAVQGDLLTDAEFAANGVALAAIEALDETDLTLDAVKAAVTVTEEEEEEANPGETFTLTTGTDSFTLTSGDDVVDGSTLNTIAAGDSILDSSSEDNDVVNITVNTAPGAFTASNIETINVNWSSIDTATIDAANITGANIVVDSTVLGFQDVTVTNVGSNDVSVDSSTAGTLTANSIKNSTIESGSAANITLTGANTAVTGYQDTATVNINNNITALTADTNVDVLNLNVTEDASITFANDMNLQDKIVVQGSSDVTLSAASAFSATSIVVNEKTDGTLTLVNTAAGAQNLTKVQADLINLKGAANGAVTVADGQNIKLSVDQTAATITGTGTIEVDVELGDNQTALDVTGVSDVNFAVNRELTTTTTLLTTDADTTVVYTGTGANNITSTGVASIDASASTGKFTYANNTATHVQGVIGSATAVNAITFVNTTANAAFTGGSAADTVSATALTTGKLAASLGAGNDTVTVTAITANAGTLVIDGGEGTDTLITGAATDFTSATLTLTNVENLSVTTGSTFSGYQLSGTSYNVSGQATNSAITVTGHATKDLGATIDLSGLVLSTTSGTNIDSVTINGVDGAANTIIGTSTADTIVAGTGADVLTGGAGDDIFTINSGDSLETGYDKVTDFTIADDSLDFDAMTIASDVAAAAAVDVKGAVAGGSGSESVSAVVTNGIVTLIGTDATLIDSLSEWVDVLETAGVITGDTAAFSFGGNTYVFNDGASNDIVELTGVTGITALGSAAAAGTVVVA